ncbi:MAG TPA: TetR/AcrR family transcriptional regulator [Candidatus Binataceae bacterium]|nr:TetR/AcrR family transcriptional regulator [Candidatus Binataceae bacterium]
MKAADAKRLLLDESVRLIEEQGLAGLSFREMARRAGLSHQAPYHYFKNREGILAALALEGFSRLDERLVAAQKKPHDNPQTALRDLMRAYMHFALDNPVHYRIMFRPELVELRRFPEAQAMARLTFQRLLDRVAACGSNASVTDQRIVELANGLWSGAHGVVTLWLDGPLKANTPGQSIASLVDATTELFSAAGAEAARSLKKSAKDSRSPGSSRRARHSAPASGNRRLASSDDRDAPR